MVLPHKGWLPPTYPKPRVIKTKYHICYRLYKKRISIVCKCIFRVDNSIRLCTSTSCTAGGLKPPYTVVGKML